MRHGKKVNHLGRTAPHRKALMANMASSLILHKRINTTLAKAKALRTYVEPLITKSKEDTTHSRRTVFAYLKDKTAVSELFRSVSVKVAERPGGYCRIIKLPNRLGDNSAMAMIELVDFNEHLTKDVKAKTTEKKTRRGRSGATVKKTETAIKHDDTPSAMPVVDDTPVETPSAEDVTPTVSEDPTGDIGNEATPEEDKNTPEA
ncbi:MAG: 50S ribosomal protein L17 [Bacteroidia bacterium]|jgi:large subunit ribosomal protein L17